ATAPACSGWRTSWWSARRTTRPRPCSRTPRGGWRAAPSGASWPASRSSRASTRQPGRAWRRPSATPRSRTGTRRSGSPHAAPTYHSERQWAEAHGGRTREFPVTWDSAVALPARGVPFTLTPPEPHGSHLQAVAGYDGARHTLLLRDSNDRHLVEMMGDALH